MLATVLKEKAVDLSEGIPKVEKATWLERFFGTEPDLTYTALRLVPGARRLSERRRPPRPASIFNISPPLHRNVLI